MERISSIALMSCNEKYIQVKLQQEKKRSLQVVILNDRDTPQFFWLPQLVKSISEGATTGIG